MGSGSNNGQGNDLANVLTGNPGNNVLDGFKGADTLTGGAGQDTFQFSGSDITSVRTITDFSVVDDTLKLSKAVFSKFTLAGAIGADTLKIGSAPADSNDYLIYNSTNGALFYDTDGNGATASVQIAVLPTGLALTYQDFFIQ